MTATSVAFFRNLNPGQPRSPRREELLGAFAAEGATDVLSHQWWLGVRATSRGAGTVLRLLDRLGHG